MLILALDSCGGAVSVACLDQDGADGPGRLLGHALTVTSTGQAAVLAPQIRRVMRDAGLRFAELDRLAVTVGPGSFTGLRVGIAAARGLALASGKPLYGITAFAAIAAALSPAAASPILVALDSRRGDLFVQLFRDQEPTSPPDVVAAAALGEWLGRHGVADAGNIEIAGDGDVAGSGLRGTVDVRFIDAGIVARLAARLPADQTLGTRPVYLRPPDAVPAAPAATARWGASP